jgi:hypothetical protein
MIKRELSISDFTLSEERCFEHLRQILWHDCLICPICSSTEIKKNGTENGKQRYYWYYWYYFIGEIIEFDELYLSVGEKGNSELSRPPRKRGLKLRGRGNDG